MSGLGERMIIEILEDISRHLEAIRMALYTGGPGGAERSAADVLASVDAQTGGMIDALGPGTLGLPAVRTQLDQIRVNTTP